MIETNSDVWTNLLAEIATKFADGTLIKHEWLKQKFGLKPLLFADYNDDIEEYVEALKMQQYAYMDLIDELRQQLLEQEKYYIRNIRGEGYMIVPPSEQVEYGYDEFRKDIRKAINWCSAVMSNTRFTGGAQAAKDRDLKAKFDSIRQHLQSIKK